MNTTYINTLDGRTKVEWWEKGEFRGRVSEIYSMSGELEPSELLHRIPIPDDSIICDLCNASIMEFPVPVVWNHALCEECFKGLEKKGGS